MKAEKRRQQIQEGVLDKNKMRNRMRNALRGVEYATEVDPVEELKRTKPAFIGKKVSAQEAYKMKKLEEFQYIASIPG